jgi:hypothetical protein
MALRIIIDRLKGAGEEVPSNLPAGKRPQLPAPPAYATMMPMVMMLGEMIFLTAFGVGLWLSGIARAVFANPMPTIDAAGPGSALLNGVGSVSEIFDGDPPFTPRGCFAQAWSVAELLRAWQATMPLQTTQK